jgi:hypothetical protein
VAVTAMTTARSMARDAYYQALRALPLRRRRQLLFLRWHHQRLRLDPPRTLSEKINWRIIHDRRPELAWTCDKLAMKEHAAAAAPDVAIPRVLWCGTDVRELAALDLPDRWVLKPNHRSAVVHLGQGRPDVEHLRRTSAGWLTDRQYLSLGEWAYSQARPLFLVEEWIGEGPEPPGDYKVWVFDGVPRLIDVHTGRFGDHRARYYRPDWTPLDYSGSLPTAPVQPRPVYLDELLSTASRIGRQFDFMRIDLYHSSGRVWFGETTPYPGGGIDRFEEAWLDQELGLYWTLPRGVVSGS